MATNKVFFDTAPFIYLIEDNLVFSGNIKNFILNEVNNFSDFVTSVVSYSEFCVMPRKLDRLDIIKDFDDFLVELDFTIVSVDIEVAKTASILRSNYSFLKGMDSLQVASALQNNCSTFFTNDTKLKMIKELSIVLVSEL